MKNKYIITIRENGFIRNELKCYCNLDKAINMYTDFMVTYDILGANVVIELSVIRYSEVIENLDIDVLLECDLESYNKMDVLEKKKMFDEVRELWG